MKNTYFNLIGPTYSFPQEEYGLRDAKLPFHGVSIINLIEKYGTPFMLVYLPKMGEQIKRSRRLFIWATEAKNYSGKYHFYH